MPVRNHSADNRRSAAGVGRTAAMAGGCSRRARGADCGRPIARGFHITLHMCGQGEGRSTGRRRGIRDHSRCSRTSRRTRRRTVVQLRDRPTACPADRVTGRPALTAWRPSAVRGRRQCRDFVSFSRRPVAARAGAAACAATARAATTPAAATRAAIARATVVPAAAAGARAGLGASEQAGVRVGVKAGLRAGPRADAQDRSVGNGSLWRLLLLALLVAGADDARPSSVASAARERALLAH